MQRIRKVSLLLLVGILFVSTQSHLTSEEKAKAKACLVNYGQLARHNLKHASSQKQIFDIIMIMQKMKKLPEESHEFKELHKEVKKLSLELSKDEVASKHLKGMRLNCDTNPH